MMALETRGPMKDEVFPMILNREKKRNSLPRGVTSEIMICEYEYHGQTLDRESAFWKLEA